MGVVAGDGSGEGEGEQQAEESEDGACRRQGCRKAALRLWRRRWPTTRRSSMAGKRQKGERGRKDHE